MAYELKQGEKLRSGMRRITKAQVNRILCTFTQPNGPKGERIHEARKDLKKARAALKLVRDDLGEKAYRRDARHLRKVARALSAPRDAQVQLQTVEKLIPQSRDKLVREALMKLHRVLQSRLREVSQQTNGGKKLKSELRAARQDAGKLPVGKLNWDDLACGIGQSYKRGSRAFQLARRTHKPEDLHEWRKRAKDLWYQLRILKPLQEEPIGALAAEMKKLSQLLGDDHDLFMIGEAAKIPELNCREQESIARQVEERRKKLRKEAFQMGRHLFGQKPSQFIERIEGYGKAAEN